MSRCQHYECVLIYSKFEDSGIPENYDVEKLSGEQVSAHVKKFRMCGVLKHAVMRSGFRAGVTGCDHASVTVGTHDADEE